MMNMLRYNNENKENFLISFVETPAEIIKLMINLINKPKNSYILDSGSGKGLFVKELLNNGYKNVEAIELNKDNYKHLKTFFNQNRIYNADYLTWNPVRKYDVIIGNPPYQHFNSLPNVIREEVANITNSRESDIYYAFINKSIDNLKENGELIYIVPYGFFYNTHAESLRKKIIENGYISHIIDLDEVRLFKGENPETIIFKFIKSKKNHLIDVLKINDKNFGTKEIFNGAMEVISNKKGNKIFEYYSMEQFSNCKLPWSSNKKIHLEKFKKLKDLAFVGVGLVSGYDKAFKVEDTSDFTEDEMDLVKKFIKGINCDGYKTSGNTKYILTEGIENESVLMEKYPNIYSIFKNHKEYMSNRYLPKNKAWYEWQALRNKRKIDNLLKYPKIFVPTLDRSKENRFSISNDRVYPAGDVLVIIPKKIDPFFLLGYLNSNFFKEYYLSHGARRGGRIAYTQRILSNIKIPVFDKKSIQSISYIVQSILESGDKSQRKNIDFIIKKALKKQNKEYSGKDKQKITTWL